MAFLIPHYPPRLVSPFPLIFSHNFLTIILTIYSHKLIDFLTSSLCDSRYSPHPHNHPHCLSPSRTHRLPHILIFPSISSSLADSFFISHPPRHYPHHSFPRIVQAPHLLMSHFISLIFLPKAPPSSPLSSLTPSPPHISTLLVSSPHVTHTNAHPPHNPHFQLPKHLQSSYSPALSSLFILLPPLASPTSSRPKPSHYYAHYASSLLSQTRQHPHLIIFYHLLQTSSYSS